ncbi:transposase [Micromonospora marina]|uniref:transposase n=1 Tax=Micromonospora marina TaxID=307120 RepID=UPI001428C79B
MVGGRRCAGGARGELTNSAWRRSRLCFPSRAVRGGGGGITGQVINGILWKLRTGVPWRELPERFGLRKSCREHLRRWMADGTVGSDPGGGEVHDDGPPV